MAVLDRCSKLAALANAAKHRASRASSGTSKRDAIGGKGVGKTDRAI